LIQNFVVGILKAYRHILLNKNLLDKKKKSEIFFMSEIVEKPSFELQNFESISIVNREVPVGDGRTMKGSITRWEYDRSPQKPFVLYTDTASWQFNPDRGLVIIAKALIKSEKAFVALPLEKQTEIKKVWVKFKQQGGGLIPEELNPYIDYLAQEDIKVTYQKLEKDKILLPP
jgi:hypothetical protein